MRSITLESSQVQFERADSLVFYSLHSGGAVALSAASFIIYDGSTVKKSGNATVATNKATVSLLGTEFTDPGQYRIVLSTTRTTGTEVLTTQHLFWVVRHKLVPMVDDTVLKKYVPALVGHLWTNETTYQDQIDQAFVDVLADLGRRGYDGSMMVDSGQLNQLLTWKSLETIFFGFIRSADDIWHERWEIAKGRYDDVMNDVKLDLSTDLSGVPNAQSNIGTIRFNR